MSDRDYERAARHISPEAVRDTLMDMVNHRTAMMFF